MSNIPNEDILKAKEGECTEQVKSVKTDDSLGY